MMVKEFFTILHQNIPILLLFNKQLITSSTIETKISTITLDSFIEINQLQKIYLLKIDVESHEVEVLQGFERYIKQFKPSILIEILLKKLD
jgi:FkbM family methyltransferase